MEPHFASPHPRSPTVTHGPNPVGGRDLVVGDVHGEFDTLEHALASLEFEPASDRTFTLGDLIDRGPRSADALGWLEQGGFARAVRGNHEQMMANTLLMDRPFSKWKSGPSALCQMNHADWWYDTDEAERERATRRWPAPADRGTLARCARDPAVRHHDRVPRTPRRTRALAWRARHLDPRGPPMRMDRERVRRERCPRDGHGQPRLEKPAVARATQPEREPRGRRTSRTDPRHRPRADRALPRFAPAMGAARCPLHRHGVPLRGVGTPHGRGGAGGTHAAPIRACRAIRVMHALATRGDAP